MEFCWSDEIQNLVENLPILERKVLNNLREAQDQALVNVANETDEKRRKFALVRLIVDQTVHFSHNHWKDIFQGYSTDHVKRMAAPNSGESTQSSLTYGEIDFFSFANILERAQPARGDIFVDLGSMIFIYLFLNKLN
jgi:hypothetical protein